jgi:hypothetical protein
MPAVGDCKQCGGYGFDIKRNEICSACNGNATVQPSDTFDAGAINDASIAAAIKKSLLGTSQAAKKAETAEVYVFWLLEDGESEPSVSVHKNYVSAERSVYDFVVDQLRDNDVDTSDMSRQEAIRRHFDNTGDLYRIERQTVQP